MGTITALLVVGSILGTPARSVSPLSWDDADIKAAATLEQLTPKEKYSLLNGRKGPYMGNIPGVGRLGVPPLNMHDSSNGFRTTKRGMLGTVTVWPSALALAATWDESMVEAQAAAIGREFRGKGANMILGPGINVHRCARGGRNFEYLSGEDPYLGARLTRSFLHGVQGEGVLAVVKHFAFNEQETRRYKESSQVDARTAWELYYPPFEAAVHAGAGSFMCAYNKVNGTWCCENEALLQRDLRKTMGFRGFVMSDWWSAHSTSVEKGLDMDQPGDDHWFEEKSLANVSGEAVDAAVRNVLRTMYRLRLDADPVCVPPGCADAQASNQTSAAHHRLAREAATAAATLLKNDGILPFDQKRVKLLAIVGSAAAAVPAAWGTESAPGSGMPAGDLYSGGGSGHIGAASAVTALDGILQRAGMGGVTVLANATDAVDGGLSVARQADAVVVVVGTGTSEGVDRKSLRLDEDADRLIRAVAKVRPTVVLMQLPGAVLTPWRDEVAAIGCLFYGGEATGHAWGSLLFGDTTKFGKLPIMLPASEADTVEPGNGEEVRYKEGLFTSYRSRDLVAAFPFGHGLSYTRFSYNGPALWKRMRLGAGAEDAHHTPRECLLRAPTRADGRHFRVHACARVTVENTGPRPGAEVVQAYVEFPEAQDTPKLQLRGFQKTRVLQPGESEVVNLPFTRRDLSTYSAAGWRLQRYGIIHIGASSADIRHAVQLVDMTIAEPSNGIATSGTAVAGKPQVVAPSAGQTSAKSSTTRASHANPPTTSLPPTRQATTKAPAPATTAGEVAPEGLTMKFPLSFEQHAVGSCPRGWSCTGGAVVCRHGALSGECVHPGLLGTDGSQYFAVGGDFGMGTATSPVFELPSKTDKIYFKRCGGAGARSGFYLLRERDDKVLCSVEDGRDTNKFFPNWCTGLNPYVGERVYIFIRDAQRSQWGKVLIDDIRLKDAQGVDIQATVILEASPPPKLRQYGKIATGTCADIGFLAITEQATCEAAARHLELADTSVEITNDLGKPEGCYYFNDARLWMNTNPLCQGEGAQTSKGKKRHPICMLQVVPLHPSATPSKLDFPLSFEADEVGSCPPGWSCTGDVSVCRVGTHTASCNHPGLSGTEGQQYLSLGADFGTGTATSPAFTLPRGVDRIRFKRSGGANAGSGFYLHLTHGSKVLCAAESGRDTNTFFDDWCVGLSDYVGHSVYIHLEDAQSTFWGKVLIDDIDLRDESGESLASTADLPADHLPTKKRFLIQPSGAEVPRIVHAARAAAGPRILVACGLAAVGAACALGLVILRFGDFAKPAIRRAAIACPVSRYMSVPGAEQKKMVSQSLPSTGTRDRATHGDTAAGVQTFEQAGGPL